MFMCNFEQNTIIKGGTHSFDVHQVHDIRIPIRMAMHSFSILLYLIQLVRVDCMKTTNVN